MQNLKKRSGPYWEVVVHVYDRLISSKASNAKTPPWITPRWVRNVLPYIVDNSSMQVLSMSSFLASCAAFVLSRIVLFALSLQWVRL